MEQYVQGLINAHCDDIKLIRNLPSTPATEKLIQLIKHQVNELLLSLCIGDVITKEDYMKFNDELGEI